MSPCVPSRRRRTPNASSRSAWSTNWAMHGDFSTWHASSVPPVIKRPRQSLWGKLSAKRSGFEPLSKTTASFVACVGHFFEGRRRVKPLHRADSFRHASRASSCRSCRTLALERQSIELTQFAHELLSLATPEQAPPAVNVVVYRGAVVLRATTWCARKSQVAQQREGMDNL
jgi:hypothetical protein